MRTRVTANIPLWETRWRSCGGRWRSRRQKQPWEPEGAVPEGEESHQAQEDRSTQPTGMPEPDASPSREGQYSGNTECTVCQDYRRCEHDQELRERGDRSSAETVHHNHKNPQHHRSEAIESTAHEGCRAEVSIGEGEREHDTKAREHETEACQDTASPPSTCMP